MMGLLAMFGLLGVGMLLIAVGTVRKNGWGVNTAPVVCPNCGAEIPRIRKPENLAQALWGGATCSNCWTEVDKWGRKIGKADRAPRPSYASHSEARQVLKKRFLTVSAVGFLVASLFGWSDVQESDGAFVWAFFVARVVVETVLFTIVFGFVGIRLYDRFFPESSPKHGQ